MAHRTFTDAQGLEWEVWEVRPGLALIADGVDRRRRQSERRGPVGGGEAAAALVSVRGQDDRRRRDRRLAVSPPLRGGWLAFRRGAERRRLAPVPAGWERDSDVQLAAYCRAAQPVTRPATPEADDAVGLG